MSHFAAVLDANASSYGGAEFNYGGGWANPL